MNVAFLSPMNLEKDGIALPAREMVGHLGALCNLTHFALDHSVHDRRHFRQMADAINHCDLLHVEHAHGFFKLPLFPFREAFLDFIRRVKIPRLVVYHEPVERIPVYFPVGDKSISGIAARTLKYIAIRAARPFADTFWVPWYNKHIFSIPERVVVHTEYRAAMVRRFAPTARISVIPAPVYGAKPRGAKEAADFRLPFDKDDVVLTVFGFIDRRKDYRGVFEALLRLPQNHKLLVAGGCFDENERHTPGSPYRRLLETIKASNLQDRVHITGFCPDWAIPEIMAASTFVIAPFLQNHSSGSVNMGLAYSRPIIAYRTLLTEEMNRNGAGLILIEGKNELASEIRRLQDDRSRFDDSIRKGARYCERLGFPAQARQFAQWYAELLSS
jgi:glycosyltransferase involved in cell wall biosynthesis